MELTTAWLLTYLVHSTLLLGAAWSITRTLERRALPVQELLWKVALVGGLATASLQVGLGLTPLTGSISLTGSPAAIEATSIATEPSSLGAMATIQEAVVSTTQNPAPETTSRVAAPPSVSPDMAEPESTSFLSSISSVSWTGFLTGLWLLGAALLTGVLGLRYLVLSRRLQGRSEVTGGAVARLFHVLAEAARRPQTRLTSSSRVPAPLARGVVQPEVCVPVRVLSDLTPEQQETLLAHEMGHVARRDPAWLLFTRVIECVFFLQPLNRVARKKLQEIAEYRCDDWAVRATGRPLDLAKCLTRVAGWNLPALPVPGIAQGRSGLGRRIHRLLSPTAGEAGRASRLLVGLVAAALVVMVWIAPGVSANPPEAPGAPEAPEAPERAEPVEAPEAPEAAEPAEPAEAPEAPEARPAPAPRPSAAPSPPPSPVRLAAVAPAPEPAPRPGAPAPPEEDMEIEVDESFDEALEQELEASLGAMETALEAALAPLEDLEIEMEALTEGFEDEMDALGESLETEIESEFGERMRTLAEKAEEGELTEAERREMEAMGRQIEARVERIQAVVERFQESFQPMQEELQQRLQNEIQPLIQQAMPDPEQLEKLTRMAHEMAREGHRLSEEETAQLREQARRLAEQSRLNEREMRELRENARRIAEEVRPNREEMRQMQEELRQEIEKMRQELERKNRQMERDRSEQP